MAPMSLTSDSVSPLAGPQLAEMRELAALADSIRSLEGAGEAPGSEAASRAAREQSAALLLQAAERLPGPESEVIAMRAAGLNGGDSAAAARRQAEVEERDLVLLCGPTSTWRRKSTATFHGAMASVPVASWNAFIDRADSFIDELVPYIAETVGQPSLTARPAPRFRIADLLCCGGEPNGFPKHFAYFLPEDEGIRGAKHAKTVVYANVYTAHHELISKPLAEAVLDPCQPWPDSPLEIMLLWFRGHDVGHQLRLPQTSFKAVHVVGRENSIALQEALADVIGYLAITGGPWQTEFGHSRATCGCVFLGEMLRYMQRGPGLFPDSDAAFFEFSYLAAAEYVEIASGSGQLQWDPHRLYDGMLALGRELTLAMLATDVPRIEALIEAHLPGTHEPLAEWRANFDARTAHVPTTLAYAPT